MATGTAVIARIDERTKKLATHVLQGMGLSMSGAIRMISCVSPPKIPCLST